MTNKDTHSQAIIGKKKGNVDTDIVSTIMAKIADKENSLQEIR